MIPIRFVDWKQCRPFRVATAAVFLSAVAALAACQTQQQIVTQHEDNLAAAGFIIRPANTPERKAMLSRLPRTVLSSGEGRHHSLYLCRPAGLWLSVCGIAASFGQYKRDQQQQHLADEQQMTADSYSDAAWNWDAWGPWGPGYGLVTESDMVGKSPGGAIKRVTLFAMAISSLISGCVAGSTVSHDDDPGAVKRDAGRRYVATALRRLHAAKLGAQSQWQSGRIYSRLVRHCRASYMDALLAKPFFRFRFSR